VSFLDSLRFLTRCLAHPGSVGSVTPSSQALAKALTAPLEGRDRSVCVLEIGAGTGPVTRRLGNLLGPEDRLDVCEIDPEFARILERTIQTEPSLAAAHAQGRVRLLNCPAQEIDAPGYYDFIISGVPLNAFRPAEIRGFLAHVQHNLRPGGVFSYFEYAGARWLMRVFPSRRLRRRARVVSRVLEAHIEEYQVARRTVILNVPPAHARHWRFADPPVPTPA